MRVLTPREMIEMYIGKNYNFTQSLFVYFYRSDCVRWLHHCHWCCYGDSSWLLCVDFDPFDRCFRQTLQDPGNKQGGRCPSKE